MEKMEGWDFQATVPIAGPGEDLVERRSGALAVDLACASDF